MLSLAMGGVAYAHWSELITVEGYIQTGNLDVNWIQARTVDTDHRPDPGLIVHSYDSYGDPESGDYYDTWAGEAEFLRYDKNVAKTRITYLEDDAVEIQFKNVYPGYAPLVWLRLEGTGTVPAHLEKIYLEYFSRGRLGTPAHVYGPFDHDNDRSTPKIVLSGDQALDLHGGMELIGWWVSTKEHGETVVLHGSTKGTITTPVMYHDMELPVNDPNMGIWLFQQLGCFLMGSDDVSKPVGAEGSWDFPGIQLHEGDKYNLHLLFYFQEHTPEDDPLDRCPEYRFKVVTEWINYNEDGSFLQGVSTKK